MTTATLPSLTVNGRTVRWNPSRPRHSWEKLALHTYRCRWCSTSTLTVHGEWWTVWQIPGEAPSDTRTGGPIPACSGPGR